MLGLYRNNGKYNGTYYIILGYLLGFVGNVVMKVLFRGSGKYNGNCYIILGYILGLYRDNGNEHGNYYHGVLVFYRFSLSEACARLPSCHSSGSERCPCIQKSR